MILNNSLCVTLTGPRAGERQAWDKKVLDAAWQLVIGNNNP